VLTNPQVALLAAVLLRQPSTDKYAYSTATIRNEASEFLDWLDARTEPVDE